ncbi:MAG: hypothetical protein ACP5VR_05610 [Acidimicrobiales bacterium]
MHQAASQAVLAAISKHQIAGIVAVVAAVLLFIAGGFKVASRAAGAALLPALGVLAVIVAVLMFTRAV